MKLIFLLSIFSAAAVAQTSWIPVPVDPVASGVGTKAACNAALRAQAGSSHTCVERIKTPATVSCPPAPAPLTHTMLCAPPLVGSWVQTATFTVGAAPTCAVTQGPWVPADAPGGACMPTTGGYSVPNRIASFQARYAAVRPGAAYPVALPAAPTITSRRTVSTAAEMQAAMGVPGVEVTFAGSGFVGTLRPGANQRWIFPAGFTLTAPADGIAINPDRTVNVELVGTGGRVVGAFQARQVADLRVRGMDIRTRSNSSQTWLDMNSVDASQRVLIEGSYLFARSYGLIYSDNRDVVLANSEVHAAGEAATTRGARNANALLIDSRIVTAGNQQQVRAHAGTPRFAFFNLQIEGGTGSYFGSAGDGCPSVVDLVMLDNSYYGQGDTIFTDGCVAGGTIVGNRGFSPWGSGSQIGVNMPAGSVVFDNPRLPATTPPAWGRR